MCETETPVHSSPILVVVVGSADSLVNTCKSEANSACHLNGFLSPPLGWRDGGFPIAHPSMLEPSGGRNKRGVHNLNRTNELCDRSAGNSSLHTGLHVCLCGIYLKIRQRIFLFLAEICYTQMVSGLSLGLCRL